MSTMTFNIRDYFRMYRKHGLRLPLTYFFENHLFDIVNGVNTHTWLPESSETETPTNREHGVIYMASWKSVIKASTLKAQKILQSTQTQLIDVGCGKGKVLCVWEKIYRKSAIENIGVEYNSQLITICKENLDNIKAKHSQVYMTDITHFDTSLIREKSIIFLYNPFDEVVLSTFLKSLPNRTFAVIYVNPIHSKIFEQHNFITSFTQSSWHPTGTYSIFYKPIA